MANVTRHIGLSLGADICWPICFEAILERLQLDIAYDGDRLSFEVERLSIEPFDLAQPCKYAVDEPQVCFVLAKGPSRLEHDLLHCLEATG